jgi:hypothetical protein
MYLAIPIKHLKARLKELKLELVLIHFNQLIAKENSAFFVLNFKIVQTQSPVLQSWLHIRSLVPQFFLHYGNF